MKIIISLLVMTKCMKNHYNFRLYKNLYQPLSGETMFQNLLFEWSQDNLSAISYLHWILWRFQMLLFLQGNEAELADEITHN